MVVARRSLVAEIALEIGDTIIQHLPHEIRFIAGNPVQQGNQTL